jgi:hypothetical protein
MYKWSESADQCGCFGSRPDPYCRVGSKRFGVNEDSRDFDHLNDRKITVVAGAKLDQEPAATTKLIVDHFGGHLSLVITLDNCEGDHQNMHQGFCITSPLYDCVILWLER